MYSVMCPCRPVTQWCESNFHGATAACLQSVFALWYQFNIKCSHLGARENWTDCFIANLVLCTDGSGFGFITKSFASCGSILSIARRPVDIFPPWSCGWSKFLTRSLKRCMSSALSDRELPIGVAGTAGALLSVCVNCDRGPATCPGCVSATYCMLEQTPNTCTPK